MKSTLTLNAALLLTSLAGLVLPTCLFAQEKAHLPAWAEKGACVFRVSTPDADDVLLRLEEGHAIVVNLLDQSIPQITIVNGLIGHDHPGPWNWDGLWPDWNRATFRAGSFDKLAAFMTRAWEKPVVVGQLLEIAPYGQFAGDKSEASWLPGEEYARKWREFCHTGILKSQ